MTDISLVLFCYQKLMLSPGETYDVELNGGVIKLTCNGSDTSLAYEMLNHEPPQCSWHFGEMDDKTDAYVLEAAEKELQRMEMQSWSSACLGMFKMLPRTNAEVLFCACPTIAKKASRMVMMIFFMFVFVFILRRFSPIPFQCPS